jgi:hypothetical protein
MSSNTLNSRFGLFVRLLFLEEKEKETKLVIEKLGRQHDRRDEQTMNIQ